MDAGCIANWRTDLCSAKRGCAVTLVGDLRRCAGQACWDTRDVVVVWRIKVCGLQMSMG